MSHGRASKFLALASADLHNCKLGVMPSALFRAGFDRLRPVPTEGTAELSRSITGLYYKSPPRVHKRINSVLVHASAVAENPVDISNKGAQQLKERSSDATSPGLTCLLCRKVNST